MDVGNYQGGGGGVSGRINDCFLCLFLFGW